jgi:hypothetical protein
MSSFDYAGHEPSRPISRATLAALVAAGLTIAVTAGALLAKAWPSRNDPDGLISIMVGKRTLVAPAQAFAFGLPEYGSVEQVDLALAWPGMGPAARVMKGPNGKSTEAPRAGQLLVSIGAADQSPDPSVRPALLYGRFLEPTVWTYPGDLLARRFRADSPYAGEELVILPPDGKLFAARCPIVDDGPGNRCVVAWRRRGLDIVLSFDRAILAEAATLREQFLTWFERSVR